MAVDTFQFVITALAGGLLAVLGMVAVAAISRWRR